MRFARSSTSALLAAMAGSLASAATPDAYADCFAQRSLELAKRSSCGDAGSLNYCISQGDAPLALAAADANLAALTVELESCFIHAGCTPAEAQVEAFWTLRTCGQTTAEERRRLDGLAAAPVLNAHMAGITQAPVVGRSAVNRREETAEASPSPCLTTTTVSITSCPIQSTGAESGKSLSCFPTTAPSSVCADGLLCQTNAEGQISCMYKHTKLDTGGIVVAIIMASLIVLSIFSVCFFCCRERNSQKRLAKAAEAAQIAREAKNAAMVANKRPEPGARQQSTDRSASQPLMAEGGDGGMGGPSAANPFADAHPALR